MSTAYKTSMDRFRETVTPEMAARAEASIAQWGAEPWEIAAILGYLMGAVAGFLDEPDRTSREGRASMRQALANRLLEADRLFAGRRPVR